MAENKKSSLGILRSQ